MPNWCENKLWINTDNKKIYNKIKTHLNTEPKTNENGEYVDVGLFGLLYPEPDYNTTPVKKAFSDGFVEDKKQAWYDWRVLNWGTKWDVRSNDMFGIDYHEDDINKEYIIEMSFSSAWSPPTEWAKYVEEKHDLHITLNYFEDGIGFCGRYETGVGDDYYEINDLKSMIQNKEIPEDLINDLDLLSYLEEEELENN